MKSIIHRKARLFPIGIGTWGIGGFVNRDPNNNDSRQIDALIYMLSKGMNFIEVNLWNAEGKSIELLAKALKASGVKRDQLFITQTIYPDTATTIEKANIELNCLIDQLKIGFVDALQVSIRGFVTYGEPCTYAFLHNALERKRTKHVSFTNCDLAHIKKYHKEFENKIFAHEIGLNFEIRENVENGVIDYNNNNDILNVIYQPIRRNRTALRNWPLLKTLAKKYDKTQNQIIFNWLVSTGNLPITKMEMTDHIDECLGSLKFKLSKEDLQSIIDFRPPNYKPPKVFFGVEGVGVRIDQLSNVFDEEYNKQQNLRIEYE